MIIYYLITSVLMLGVFALFVHKNDQHKVTASSKLITGVMFFTNMGYLAVSLSQNLSEALLAEKMVFLGGCFLPSFFFFLIRSICSIEPHKWEKPVLYTYSGLVYCMALSAGYMNFFYKDVEFVQHSGGGRLSYEPGAGYFFFGTIMFGYIIVDIIFSLISIHRRQVSKRIVSVLICIQIITSISFMVEDGIFVPAIHVIDGILIFFLSIQLDKYNLTDNIVSAIMKNNTSAYILIDSSMNYIGSNDIAQKIWPEIKKCKVDKPLTDERLRQFVEECIGEYMAEDKEELSWWHNNKYYEAYVRDITHSKTVHGYLIELQEHTDRKRYMDLLTEYNDSLQLEVNQKTKHIRDIQRKVILGMADIVESRDDNTGGHIKRTSKIVRILIKTIKENQFMELSDEFCEDLIKAAPMHDLGKIGIDDQILRKPGRYTEEEFAVMRTHSEKSAEICESILRGVEEDHFVDVAVNVAKYHHEKWNGEGYPLGKMGDDIPLEARIMAIADVYDALVSKRCYKEAMNFEDAYQLMLDSMGSHFDPGLKQAFILSRDKLESYYRAG